MIFQKSSYSEKWKAFLIMGIISFIFLNLFSPYTSVLNQYFGIDTAQYWVIGRGMFRGKIPYVDLFDHKGPVIFFVWALGWMIGNGTKWGILCLQTVSLTICLVYLNKLTDLFQMGIRKKCIVFLVFLFVLCGTLVEGGLTEEWALPCSMYGIYVAYSYFRGLLVKPVWMHAFLLGVLFTYVAGMRVNNAVSIGMTVFFMTLVLLKRRAYKTLGKSACAFLGGMTAAGIPVIIIFGSGQRFQELIYGSLSYNFFYAVDGTNKSWQEWAKIFSYEGFAVIALLCLLIYMRKQDALTALKKEEYGFALVNLTVTGLCCILGYTWQHYFMLYLPCIVLAACLAAEVIDTKKLVFLAAFMIIPYSWQTARNVGKNVLFDVFGYYDETQRKIGEISDIIPDEDKEHVWAIDWCTSKWFAINDITPCYKVFDFPHVLGNSEKLYAETQEMLETDPPRWILRQVNAGDYIEGYSQWLEENYFLEEILFYEPQGIIQINQKVDIEVWHIKCVEQ